MIKSLLIITLILFCTSVPTVQSQEKKGTIKLENENSIHSIETTYSISVYKTTGPIETALSY